MSKGSSIGSILAGAAIFISLEIAALAMLSRSSALQNIWMNRASHRTAVIIWSGGEKLHTLFTQEKRNRELAGENEILRAKLRSIEGAFSATDSAVTAFESKCGYAYIPASIVRVSSNSAHNFIILDKGSDDGIEPQCGIISDKGIIGIITAVDKRYSYGLTIMNPNLSISARVKRTGYLAPLMWDGIHKDRASLKDLPIHHATEPGDTVVTSGFSSIFPPDIPIGVTGKNTIVDGSLLNTEVTLFQSFSTVRYVTVIKNLDRGEIDAIAEKGEEAL